MREIESISDLDDLLAESTGSLAGLRLQGVDLTARADQLLGWLERLPAWPLLAALSHERLMAGRISLARSVDEAGDVLTALG